MQPLLPWKTISIRYSECVYVSLRMQHACAILSSVACPALQLYLLNGTIFNKTLTEHKICVLIFSTKSWQRKHGHKYTGGGKTSYYMLQ